MSGGVGPNGWQQPLEKLDSKQQDEDISYDELIERVQALRTVTESIGREAEAQQSTISSLGNQLGQLSQRLAQSSALIIAMIRRRISPQGLAVILILFFFAVIVRIAKHMK